MEIISGLYLGNKYNAIDENFLNSRKINIIINLSLDIPFIKNFNEIKKIRINLKNKFNNFEEKNKYNNEFSYQIPNLLTFIWENIQKGKNILIHDKNGKFSSISLILCFLMKYLKINLNNAYKVLRIKIPIKKIEQNPYFDCLNKIENELKSNI